MPKNAAAAQKAKEKKEKKLLELQMKQSKEKCDEGKTFLEPEGKAQPQFAKAIALFDSAIELYPENSEAFTLRATAYLEQKQPEHAIEDFTKALSLNSQSVSALEGRASCYESLHQWDKAIADCTAIIAIQPENDHAFNLRGMCRLRKRPMGLRLKNADFALVVEDFSTAARLNENNFHALTNLGKTYEEHGQYKRAIEQYTKALKIKDDYTYALFRRGCAAMCMVEAALKAEPKELNPATLTVSEQLALEEETERLNRENRDLLKQAITDLTKVIGDEKEKELTALVYRGSCYHMSGDMARAAEDFNFVKNAAHNPDLNCPPGLLDVIRIRMEGANKE